MVTPPVPKGTLGRAFLARRFTPRFEAALAARLQIARLSEDRPASPEELAQAALGCSHLIVSVTERVPGWLIERLQPDLKVIASLSVGYEHIDLGSAQANKIAVLLTPDVLSAACADLAMMLILNAARRGHEANELVRSGGWQGWAPTQLLGVGLAGRRLGILGMGRIGREVAHRARAFGLDVHYHNRRPSPYAQSVDAIYHADADELLTVSDILLLCAPAVGDMIGFLDRRRLRLLPERAIVVNIARGDVVVDDDLIEALRSGRLFAAGLDVFAGEPALHPRYRTLPNVFLTPHLGSATEETRDAMGLLLVQGIDALANGERPANRIC